MERDISTVALGTCGSCGDGLTVAPTACHTSLSRPKAAGCACGSVNLGEGDAVIALALAAPGQPFSEGVAFGFLPLGLGHAGHQ